MSRDLLRAALLACFALPLPASAHEAHGGSDVTLTAAYAFPLPAPGSYPLPAIKPAGSAILLDETGRKQDLRALLRDRITVIGFVYTRCGEVCPAASLDMSRLQDLAARERVAPGRFRLITVSFDPEHDTPNVMGEYASSWRSADASAPEWIFLTAADAASLAPLLAAYDQRVDRKPVSDDAQNGLSHLFRGFLVDAAGRIRNIYSLDFFDPRLVLTDIRSLETEER